MPSLETTITVGIVFAAVLALLHIVSSGRAGVVLAHQRRYEEALKPAKSESGPATAEKPSGEPIIVG